MNELFRQLAFITAILGGFAITFLSVLLTAPATQRLVNRVAGVTAASAVCFVLSALGSTFSAVIASNAGDSLPREVEALHEPLSLLFLAGTVLLFVVLGMSGWMRSRPLGIATSVIAALGLIGGAFIIAPFIVAG